MARSIGPFRHLLLAEHPPIFLAPSLGCRSFVLNQRAEFSTTGPLQKKTGDRNKNRGVSALRRTGPRKILSVSNEPLPKPVLDPSKRSKVKVDKNHGLWEFFNIERTPISTPEAEAAHGRAWTVHELRNKSFEDLWGLWWVCAKERNRIATQEFERSRVKAGYGEQEATLRDKEVRLTQRAIKHALTERWYAWQSARRIAAKDPELNDFLVGEQSHVKNPGDGSSPFLEDEPILEESKNVAPEEKVQPVPA